MGNRIDTSAFPDLWERVMYRKVLKFAQAYGECKFHNFPNITNDHKSRDTQAISHDVLPIIYSTNLFHRVTLKALHLYSHILFIAIKNIMLPHVK